MEQLQSHYSNKKLLISAHAITIDGGPKDKNLTDWGYQKYFKQVYGEQVQTSTFRIISESESYTQPLYQDMRAHVTN